MPDAGAPGPDDEAAGRLEQRLDRATEAAERLISEAAQAALRRPPPAGWQQTESEQEARPDSNTEVELLFEALRALRNRIPPDLERRLGEALRELLLALRALIDWYLERSGGRTGGASEVEDIPIL